jgi:solute carrier family 25 phosphate transporter 23/24/25/41
LSADDAEQFFEDSPGSGLGAYKRLFCGGLAGITSVTFTYPLDIVRTRLSIQSASFADLKKQTGQKLPGMWSVLKKMYKTEGGISALYRGIIPTVAGVAPYVGLNFMVYESMRVWFTPAGEKDPSALGKLGAGAISGAVAQTCTYPLYVSPSNPSRTPHKTTQLTIPQRRPPPPLPNQHHVRHGLPIQLHHRCRAPNHQD